MSVLAQTLYCASGRIASAISNNPDTTAVDSVQNTPAGTHDGLDSTFDKVAGTNSADDGDLDYYVEYQMDPCTALGTIDFIRFLGRMEVLNGGAVASFISPSIDALGNATASVSYTDIGVWHDWSFDVATFLADMGGDGLAWTAARINVHKLGFHIGLSWADPTCDGFNSEFKVEVWVAGTQSDSAFAPSIIKPALKYRWRR